MRKLPKAKCEKCEHCKVITQYNVIICDYLNGFNKQVTTQAFCRPRYCCGFSKKKKAVMRNENT